MNPLLVFFLIAFGVPWVGWSLIQFLGDTLTPLQRILLFYTGNFCSLAGFAATYAESGRPGVKALWQRCIRIRVSAVWWLVVFLIPFFVALLSIQAWRLSGNSLGITSPMALLTLFTPALMRNLTTGPLGEEAGWRGYLLPKLLERYSGLKASVIIGIIWGIWHLPLYIDSEFSTLSGATVFTLNTVFYSIIMTVIYNHTNTSVFVAVIFHWFINMLPIAVLNMYVGVTLDDIYTASTVIYGLIAVMFVLMFGTNLKRETRANGK